MTELLLWPEDSRLAAVYDVECAGRWDHDFYLDLAGELSVETVLDLGCGTGVFVADAAKRGMTAVGVDPAKAILDVAAARVAAAGIDSTVRLIQGDIADVADPAIVGAVDLVIMMGHVAQYFITDEEWSATLRHIKRVLRPGGFVAFETRNPAVAWATEWTEENTRGELDHPDGGRFSSWVQVMDLTGSDDSYVITHHGHTVLPSGEHLVAEEQLRFRSHRQVTQSLAEAGFTVESVWGDWERAPWKPESREIIVLART